MKKQTKVLGIVLAINLSIFLFVGCSNQEKNTPNTQSTSVNGSITMAGSTSMESLANVLAEAYMEKHVNVVVQTEFIGSSAGIEQLLAGTVQIGNASRALKDSEVTAGAVENVVAIDGIGVILNKKNTVTNITKDQLVAIFTGEMKYWDELGGKHEPIVVIGRESGSGTRGAFEELLGMVETSKYSNEINSTGGVMAKVASTPGAIGYVSIDIIDNSVKAATIEKIEATVDTIKNGQYILSRPYVMATKGEISEQNEVIQSFFEYLKSEEGKQMIQSVGLIVAD